MARQFEVRSTGWQHANLIVGWNPALGTYYGTIYDSTVDELGPLLLLTPHPGIQDAGELEAYINENVQNKWGNEDGWPIIKLNKLTRINLERDRLEEGGYWNEIQLKQI